MRELSSHTASLCVVAHQPVLLVSISEGGRKQPRIFRILTHRCTAKAVNNPESVGMMSSASNLSFGVCLFVVLLKTCRDVFLLYGLLREVEWRDPSSTALKKNTQKTTLLLFSEPFFLIEIFLILYIKIQPAYQGDPAGLV